VSNILRSPNGNGIHLAPRSGSNSLSIAAFAAFWPDIAMPANVHPANAFPIDENWDGGNANVGLIVRNPVERFRSMCAHRPERTLEEHLDAPVYGPLPTGNFARYFRFEDQLDTAAEWLGLPTPLIHEDKSDPNKKPNLTSEQEAIVRTIYAKDIELWESL